MREKRCKAAESTAGRERQLLRPLIPLLLSRGLEVHFHPDEEGSKAERAGTWEGGPAS